MDCCCRNLQILLGFFVISYVSLSLIGRSLPILNFAALWLDVVSRWLESSFLLLFHGAAVGGWGVAWIEFTVDAFGSLDLHRGLPSGRLSSCARVSMGLDFTVWFACADVTLRLLAQECVAAGWWCLGATVGSCDAVAGDDGLECLVSNRWSVFSVLFSSRAPRSCWFSGGPSTVCCVTSGGAVGCLLAVFCGHALAPERVCPRW